MPPDPSSALGTAVVVEGVGGVAGVVVTAVGGVVGDVVGGVVEGLVWRCASDVGGDGVYAGAVAIGVAGGGVGVAGDAGGVDVAADGDVGVANVEGAGGRDKAGAEGK